MSQFSLELNEDHQQIQQWIHDFAEGVVRPVAAEWDEREETPWPVIEEAANIGLYSLDFFANGFADETGLTIPIALEELFWAPPAAACPSSAPSSVWPASWPTAPLSRSASGSRSASAPPTS